MHRLASTLTLTAISAGALAITATFLSGFPGSHVLLTALTVTAVVAIGASFLKED